MSEFSFTAYVRPEPQGSSKAFVIGSLGDSLIGILYHDDAQVVEGFSRKVYGEIEQVRVTVYEVTI